MPLYGKGNRYLIDIRVTIGTVGVSRLASSDSMLAGKRSMIGKLNVNFWINSSGRTFPLVRLAPILMRSSFGSARAMGPKLAIRLGR